MAQDRQQQSQGQAQTQTQPQSSRDDSPHYDSRNAPADCTPAVRWLLGRGWKCQADNPRLERGRWLPPGASDTDVVTDVYLYGPIMRPSRDKVDADGNPIAEPNFEQLHMQDGSPAGNTTVPIKQTLIVPAAKDVSFEEALQIERARESKARGQKKVGPQRLQPVGAN